MCVWCVLYHGFTNIKQQQQYKGEKDEHDEPSEMNFMHHVKEKQKNHKPCGFWNP